MCAWAVATFRCRPRGLSVATALARIGANRDAIRSCRGQIRPVRSWQCQPDACPIAMLGAKRRRSMNGALVFSSEAGGRSRTVHALKDCLPVDLSRAPTCGLSAYGRGGHRRRGRRLPTGSDVAANGLGLSIATIGTSGEGLHERFGVPSNRSFRLHKCRGSAKEAAVREVPRDACVSREIEEWCWSHSENWGRFTPHVVAVRRVRHSR